MASAESAAVARTRQDHRLRVDKHVAPCRRATRDRGEVEDGPQHLNKNPLMFTCESLTMDDVEAGAGNPVRSARLA